MKKKTKKPQKYAGRKIRDFVTAASAWGQPLENV